MTQQRCFSLDGEYGTADLCVFRSSWGRIPVGVMTVTANGAGSPKSVEGRQYLNRAMEDPDLKGFQIAYRAVPWRADRENWVRPIVLRGDAARFVELLGE